MVSLVEKVMENKQPKGLPAYIHWHQFENRVQLASALAEYVAENLYLATCENVSASLAVSGGSTPIPFFEALSRSALDWADITVALVDERCVGVESSHSNERLVRESLLIDKAAQARFIGLYHASNESDSNLSPVREQFNRVKLPLDVVVLGMGNDGHTASFFPHAKGLEEAFSAESDKICCMIEPVEDTSTGQIKRITLNAAMLLSAQIKILHITGEEKLDTLKRALDPGPVEEMPIRSFFSKPLHIYWSP